MWSTYVGETISCEICTRWFHFTCVGVTHEDDCVKSEDVPYYCPSCDVSIRKAKKAKRQAQAKEMKARAASEVIVETKIELGNEFCSDNTSDADSEKLVIDTNKHKSKTGKTKLQAEKKFSVVTQVIPQLEVSQLKTEDRRTEEEAWLEAVESGDLDQVESCDSELRSLREPSFRTARQRALAGGDDDTLEMLDFGVKKMEKEITDEEKAIKAQKRKELETEKREKMKQKTMDTLLKKKDSKVTKQIKTAKSSIKEETPVISYINNSQGISLSYPLGEKYPLNTWAPVPPPETKSCVMCPKRKKYNSAKTGSPVCSLECYKSDLARMTNVIVWKLEGF